MRQKLEALLRRAEDEASLWLRNAASYRRAEPRDLDTALRCEIRAYEWECITDLLRDALDS